jgi:S-adenosylhomocysteine hydrolase
MRTALKEKRGLKALHLTLMQTGLFTNEITSSDSDTASSSGSDVSDSDDIVENIRNAQIPVQ